LLFCAVKEYNMLKNRILIYILFTALTALVFTACAKRGSITGGAKDTIAPYITGSSPENMTTEFKGNEIRINFNEYIKIKDVNKQLIISPPMATAPLITPAGSASKSITIKIKDTLKENTTYSFNFGQSITDNNEGNPYSQFKFIFSTGTYIDSLTLNGKIKDAYANKTDNFVSVILYEADSTFTDSTIYKQRPRYVTNTLDSTVQFSLQNLKQGKYHIIALKDVNNNYKFDPKTDKIGFLNQTIDVPNDTIYQLELFQEKRAFKPLKPVQATSNRLYAAYEGKDHQHMKVQVRNGADTEDIQTLTTKVKDKDSLQVWLPRKLVADSLKVTVTHRDSIKKFNVKFKELKAADSLTIDAVQKGGLHFREKFTLVSSTPLITIDSTKIRLINKDSIAMKYSMAYDDMKQELVFDFPKEESQKYTFTLMPGALKDFYEKESDTLVYKLATKTYADYGNLRLTLANAKRFPLMLEVLNSKGTVEAFYYSEGETKINFDSVLPDKYTLRVYYDDNKNKEWDTGDYLLKRQPEEVIYLPKEIDVRANWDPEETFNLGG
jgi:hypothetical protein